MRAPLKITKRCKFFECSRQCNGNYCAPHELELKKLLIEVFGDDDESESEFEIMVKDILDLKINKKEVRR